MAEDQIRSGVITRVVHVRFAPPNPGQETKLGECHGYGIVQDIDGRELFFVDSALQDAPFSDLETGRQARFLLEDGPLGRVSTIWVNTPQAEISVTKKPASGNQQTGNRDHDSASAKTGNPVAPSRRIVKYARIPHVR